MKPTKHGQTPRDRPPHRIGPSHAWGQPDEGSDLDLLVVVRESSEPPVRRAQRCLRGLGISKDILVKTKAELERFRHVRSSLEAKILERGRLIYG